MAATAESLGPWDLEEISEIGESRKLSLVLEFWSKCRCARCWRLGVPSLLRATSDTARGVRRKWPPCAVLMQPCLSGRDPWPRRVPRPGRAGACDRPASWPAVEVGRTAQACRPSATPSSLNAALRRPPPRAGAPWAPLRQKQIPRNLAPPILRRPWLLRGRPASALMP